MSQFGHRHSAKGISLEAEIGSRAKSIATVAKMLEEGVTGVDQAKEEIQQKLAEITTLKAAFQPVNERALETCQ